MRSIFIGSSAEQKIPSLVLEYSVRKHSTVEDLGIIHTYDKTFPSPRKPENRSRTGFSFARFAIPEMMGYRGVAAYLECDQLVFADVRELFELPFNGATVLRTPNQASVLVLDCDHIRWHLPHILESLDAGRIGYRDLMENLAIEPKFKISKSIPVEWNSLESYHAGKTRLLHYTNMALQPWRKAWNHPLGHLWMGALREAVEKGAIGRETVEEEVARGHVIKRVLEALR